MGAFFFTLGAFLYWMPGVKPVFKGESLRKIFILEHYYLS
jgi:hypothetical protein